MIDTSSPLARAVAAAIRSIEGGNNGYADIGNSPAVIDAVRAAGYTVILSTNCAGAPTHKGFSRAAQKALAASPFGVSTYRPPVRRDDFDYEGAILARQERAGLYD